MLIDGDETFKKYLEIHEIRFNIKFKHNEQNLTILLVIFI